MITQAAMETPDLVGLAREAVVPEPIEAAAPDLLARALPALAGWRRDYHASYDTRAPWSEPPPGDKAFGRALTPKERLLWQLEDNIEAPLATGDAIATAAEVLTRFIEEPDNELDGNLNRPPYLERLHPRMGLLYDGTSHTHTFRHYYVPRSLIPPLAKPLGDAAERSATYAWLAYEAFRTGHRYWGYRFLSWAAHYAQDATQPWHTVLLPSVSFLRVSVAAMRKRVAAYHYLTEALADAWLARHPRAFNESQSTSTEIPEPLRTSPRCGPFWGVKPEGRRRHKMAPTWGECANGLASDPWAVAKLVAQAARVANERAAELAAEEKPLFEPILERLNDDLKPASHVMSLGGAEFPMSGLDFTGNGAGATAFLAPLWGAAFELSGQLVARRDRLVSAIAAALSESVTVTRRVFRLVLTEGFAGNKIH